MKKRDEGYVLPLVLIVLVVICLIAVSLLTVSLNNLKNQQAMIDRMEDQYAAQGMIEEAVAGLQVELFKGTDTKVRVDGLSYGALIEKKDQSNIDNAGYIYWSKVSGIDQIKLKITATSGTKTVATVVVFSYDESKYTTSYESYEISNSGGDTE